MSLYAASNGILETHVTWEDVEADLQEKLCTRATFGDNKKAVNISEMKVRHFSKKNEKKRENSGVYLN